MVGNPKQGTNVILGGRFAQRIGEFAARTFIVVITMMLALTFGSRVVAAPASSEQAADHDEFIHSCGQVSAGFARCHAILHVKSNKHGQPTPTPTGTPTPTPTPISGCGTNPTFGYTPCDLVSAYVLPSATAGNNQTVAVVDAFDDPNAEADLGVYRAQFGLSPCTTANGCFRKVDQTGGTNYPRRNVGWAQEISLDLDMVSAICPNCKILLVEATTNSFTNLAAAVNEAATLGANEISNSYGGSEFSGEATDQSYNHPGIAITASSGDTGFGPQYPAASSYLTAVGGTTLTSNNSARGWGETAWSGAGSGCSAYITQPSWQSTVANITANCSHRGIADVSAVADPNTGVDVYDTYGSGGWLVFGGTSVASPIIASVYALGGNANTVNYGSYPYSHTSNLFDIISGSNGSCGGAPLCTAVPGWDGPTGNGTPNGTSGF